MFFQRENVLCKPIEMIFKLILKQPLQMGALVQPTVVLLLVMDSVLIGAKLKTLVVIGAFTLAHGTTVNTKLILFLTLLLIGKPNMTTCGVKSKLTLPFQPTTQMQWLLSLW